MIAIIRIHGRVGLKKEIEETLKRLKLIRKYSCVLIDEKDNVRMGMLKKINDYVAYGKISGDIEKQLKDKRAKKDKDFFSLHPPRGGMKRSTKLSYKRKGVLGKWDDNELDKLLARML